ncbi:MAG: WYL domain-containing protein [Spirulinaceae cyanobacterium]
MSRKGQSITLSISEHDKAELESLALEFDMKWGERPNISKLVEAIARRKLQIAPNHNWAANRINALERARNALIDAGMIEEAITIAHLLLERSEITIPLRDRIQQFLGNPPPPWRLELDKYIKRQQPFQLFYQDATGRPWNFTVRYAQIVTHEERQYLDCWCEETEGNLDIEQLQHNWSLRIDRIPEAAIMPIKGQWQGKLDKVQVEIHFFERLAFAYKVKAEDELSEWLPEQPRVKRVLRSISSTYWFIREIFKNSPDAAIISPQSVRDRFIKQLTSLNKKYGLESKAKGDK